LIGNQCWLKSNLNVGTKIDGSTSQTNNSIIEKYCYENNDVNCADDGGLYQWEEMMNYTTASSGNPSGRQGICMAGWHVPSDAEYCVLTSFLDANINCLNQGFQGIVGGLLKDVPLVHWQTPNTGATNTSGFTAFGAGYRNSNGTYSNHMKSLLLWTTTNGSSAGNYVNWNLSYTSAAIARWTVGSGVQGYSVRCLKDF
jgi:uncharacterized protein (TIGR02145 family)